MTRVVVALALLAVLPSVHVAQGTGDAGVDRDAAATALVQRWAVELGADTMSLAQMANVTSRLRDRRLLDAVLAATADSLKPYVVRRTALKVVVAHWRPGATLTRLAGSPELQDVQACGFGFRSHFESADGEVPIREEDRTGIRERVLALAESEADPAFRHALLCAGNAMTSDPHTSSHTGDLTALAQRWSTDAGTDTTALAQLVYVTSRLHDRRLLDAVLTAAADQARPYMVRRAALDVAVAFWRPGAVLPLTAGEPALQGVRSCGFGFQSHVEPTEGNLPIRRDDRLGIRERVLALAESEADPAFRHALLCAGNAMTYDPHPPA